MKIALVINELNIKGGTHKQLIRLTAYLSSRNHHIRIFTKQYSPELYPLDLKNVEVISYNDTFNYSKIKPVRYIKTLVGSIRMGRDICRWAEIINIHDNWLLIPNIYIKLCAPSKKIVWQINDLHPAFAIGNSKKQNQKWYYSFIRKANRWVAKKNDALTVNVAKNKDRVQKLLHCSAMVFYCGVDIRNQNFAPRPINRNSTVKLLSVGVFFKYRNYETVLKVHEQLSLQYGLNVETTIVGSTRLDPDYAVQIKAFILQKGMKAKVLGQVTDAELNILFKDAHFFLFLNIDQSWGLAVFEAMNYSLPVILSESVGAVELLDSNTACIINPTDYKEIAEKINGLVVNKESYERLGLNGFNHVSNMTWDKMYSQKMETLFYNLLNQPAPA